MEEKMMLHTNLKKSEVGKYVFLPGSPQRVERIAKYLDNPSFLKVNREHETWVGYLEGERVLVTSTGMGGPSTAIALEELIELGADTFIRIGSCATTSDKCGRGDVVIPSACVRMEGTSLHYGPIEFPAVPNIEVFDALRNSAREYSYKSVVGTVISRDGFYSQYDDFNKPSAYYIKPKWEAYKSLGAIATEMEASTLFVAASSLNVRAGAVMVCATDYKKVNKTYPMDFEARSIEIAVKAMTELIKQDKNTIE